MKKIHMSPDMNFLAWVYRFFDLWLPLILLAGLTQFVSSVELNSDYWLIGIFSGIAFVSFGQLSGLYRTWRGDDLFLTGRLILQAWFLAWSAIIIMVFFLKESESYSRLVMISWAAITPFISILIRLIIRYILGKVRNHPKNQTKIAIVGASKVGQQLAKNLLNKPLLGYQIHGFFDDNESLLGTKIDGIKILGTTETVCDSIALNAVDEVYICLPLRAESKIKSLLNELNNSSVVVKFIPDFFTFDLMHAQWMEIDGLPIVSIYDTPLNSLSARLTKRLEDVVLSTFILIGISPILVMIAVAIKTTSKGPVIFKQTRYGVNGQKTNIYKFRTMTTLENDENIQQAQKGDTRITSIGRFLRKTSLDELPQFVNVLQGKMSIVGPRPHAVVHNEQYRKLVPKYMQRHLVKPGITGWAQVNGWRGETDTLDKMQKRIEFDLHYINHWSVWLDLKIIVQTVYKGFIHKNAR